MRDRLSFQFEYSPREHVRALDETPYRRLLKKWWVPGSIAFTTLLFGSTFFRPGLPEGSPSSSLSSGVFVGVLMLATLLLTPTIMRRFEIARYRRVRPAKTAAMETREFGKDGVTQGEGVQAIPWPMITRVIESDNFYLFYNALSDTPDYLPKRVVGSADAAALEALLHNEFRSRAPDLVLLPRAT